MNESAINEMILNPKIYSLSNVSKLEDILTEN